MCIYISCEQKTKKLYLFIFLFLITDIIFLLLSLYYIPIEFNYIRDFNYYIGSILVILPYAIYKIYNKIKNNNKPKIKKPISINYKKDIIFFILIIILHFLYYLIIINNEKKEEVSDIFFYHAFLLLSLSLLMKILNDFKFYRHRILSLILFSIFTLIIDIIIYVDIFKIYGILDICCVFLYTINFTYQQYLITIKNISFYIVCSFFGLVSLITIFIINFDWIRQYEVIDCFSALLKTLPYTFLYAIINFIYYLIAYNFSFIHSEIINLFLNISQIIFDIIMENSYDYKIIIILIIFIFALISFFIYLEIIELKCCGLNKNTRRNILIRENIDKTEINENINKENEDKNVIKSENQNIELTEEYLVDITNIPNRYSNL